LRRWQRFSLLLLFLSLVYAEPSITEELLTARDLCYHQNYALARAQVSEITCQNHHEIPGFFWHCCLLQLLIYDSGNTALIDSFYQTCDLVVKKCQKKLKQNPADAHSHLYLGLALLNRANLLSWQNRKFNAFMTLLRVPFHLNRALELDPQLADAKFGLAVIEYFKATADRYWFGLGLFGSRERAYRLMKTAQSEAKLLQPMAEFMLGFMYKEDREYAVAVKWGESLLGRYPNNRAARRLLRDIYLDMGNYQRAIELGRKLDTDIATTFPENRYGRAENWLKMAYAWQGMDEPDSVCIYAERIIAWNSYVDCVPWLGNYVREAKLLKRKLRRG